MSKARLRIASLLSLVAGLGAYPLSACLFPYARAADSIPGSDGQGLIVSIDAGTWIFKVGLVAALIFVGLSCVLLWLSFRSRERA